MGGGFVIRVTIIIIDIDIQVRDYLYQLSFNRLIGEINWFGFILLIYLIVITVFNKYIFKWILTECQYILSEQNSNQFLTFTPPPRP